MVDTNFFFVEGNVGTGKSTFLKKLFQLQNFETILEPVDQWTQMKNENGRNLLEEFYGNQERNAYLFQSIAFRTRIKTLSSSLPSLKPKFVERSIFTDRNVFAKTCYENKKMTDIEWTDYCQWFEWLTEHFKIKPKGYIYLRADPEVSFQRIQSRSRSGEETLSFEYLKELHAKHDQWLLDEPNVLVLNVNEDFEKDDDSFKNMVDKINIFIQNVHPTTDAR